MRVKGLQFAIYPLREISFINPNMGTIPIHTAAITESDVRAAYAKLRDLSNATPPDSKRTEIEKQAKLIENFMWNNKKDPNTPLHAERYAEEALAEGHVELFEKVANWCQLFWVTTKNELGPWGNSLYSLYVSLNFRAHNSLKLANRLAKSKHYIRMLELHMRWNISDENQLILILQNDLSLLNCAPDASVSTGYTLRRRGIYPLILKLYNTKKCANILLFDTYTYENCTRTNAIITSQH